MLILCSASQVIQSERTHHRFCVYTCIYVRVSEKSPYGSINLKVVIILFVILCWYFLHLTVSTASI